MLECVFFSSQANTTLAVFRICYGFILTLNAVIYFTDAKWWFFPNGVYSHTFFEKHYKKARFSLFSFLPASPNSVYLILYLNLLASIFLMVGFCTQVNAFLVFVTLTSLNNRNMLIKHAGDFILRIMAILLIFSPAGTMLSIDHYLAMRASGEVEVVTYSSQWSLRLMQLQVCIIYLKAFLSKARKEEWINGTAAYYPTQLATYQRFSASQVFKYPLAYKAGTWGTLLIQFSLGTLVWVDELRYPVLISGLLFHLMIEYLMNIQLFSWIMILCLLLFIPPHNLQFIVDCLAGATSVEIGNIMGWLSYYQG